MSRWPKPRWPRFASGLGFRLAVLLSVALLPLGIISVAQTLRVLADARQTSETALIGLTADAVAGQRALIEGALGAARALGPVLSETFDRPEECAALAAEFVQNSGFFAFAGFLSPDGTACMSEGIRGNFAGTDHLDRRLARIQTMIEVRDAGAVTGLPVLVISEPIWRQGVLRGFVVLSMPYGALEIVGRFGAGRSRPSALHLLDVAGNLLIPQNGREAAAATLPARAQITEFTSNVARVVRGDTVAGQRATFVSVPVIPQQVYALGVWPHDTSQASWERDSVLALLFPFLMWFVSLSVAFFAVHRLVIRHVVHLNGQMRRFAVGQRGDFASTLPGRPPAEFRQLNSTFNKLRRIITREEANRAAALHEKTVLLKEVHHRVKNNLQLIASIVNMQMRKVQDPALRRVLKSVQDRVMSLATIHRILYQSDRVSDVRVDSLLHELLKQLGDLSAVPGMEVQLSTDLDPVRLFPDQVVPLSLLATEAITNAYKFIGRPTAGAPWLRINFKAEPDGRVLFEVVNSIGAPVSQETMKADSTSLGGQLIAAFARQLEAEVEEGPTQTPYGAGYRLALRFPVAGFIPPEPG
ncbi:sensor histidine kinase [Plastorhodobacter daqingensis]|uniref:histidine kinase n=1 Tax=Plastorhodobacter daqingensis TaxID=1387281 RepID=A0ABW2UP90_9RHOB